MKGTIALITLLASSAAASAQLRNPARDSLRDIGGVYVLVDSLNDDLQKSGLTKDLLKADVESQLRKADVDVFADERQQALAKEVGNREPRSTTYLYVRIVSAGDPSDVKRAFSVSVQLHQTLSTSQRDGPTTFFGPSWSADQVGLAARPGLRQRIQDVVKELVDRFSSDYLAANPRK